MALAVRHHGVGGPRVVVLHGGPGAPGSARGLARALSGHFSVLEPLQRRSGAVPLTIERHVEDLAAVAPRAAVVGWSWGAMLGLSYAVRHPELVTALVLVGCGTYSTSDRQLYSARLEAALGAKGRARRDELRVAISSAEGSGERDHLLAELGSLYTAAQSVDLLDEDNEDDHEGALWVGAPYHTAARPLRLTQNPRTQRPRSSFCSVQNQRETWAVLWTVERAGLPVRPDPTTTGRRWTRWPQQPDLHLRGPGRGWRHRPRRRVRDPHSRGRADQRVQLRVIDAGLGVGQ